MKKLIIFGIIILIALIIFTIFGVRAVTANPDIGAPEVIIEIDEGGVEVWPAGGSTWQRVKDGQTLGAGDRVRTLEDSSASIIFYDNSVMRLDENTEITISELDIDPENYLDQKVSVELIVGRAWSRIMNLLDLDSSYEVQTSSVVATVRGTSFTMSVDERGETEVDVTESMVELALFQSASGSEEIITTNPRQLRLEAGRYITRGAFKNLTENDQPVDVFNIESQSIDEDRLKSSWYLKNMTRDEDFSDRIWGLRRDKLRRYIKILPDSPFFGLQRLGEKLGLAISGEEKKETLQNIYMARRLAEVAELAHLDKVGLASQELIQFGNTLKEDGDASRARLNKILPNLMYLQQGFWADVLPVEKSYRLKQKMEELGLERDITPEKIIYWRLVNLEQRLTEAQRLIQYREKDIVTNVLEAARLGLENLRVEADALPDSPGKEIILSKIDYDLKKFGIIQEEIKLLEFQSPELLQPTDDLELTEEGADEAVTEPEDTTAPVEEPSEETPTEEPASEPGEEKTVQSLSVSALPNPVLLGGAADLFAQARYTDGSSEDVSSRVNWTVYGAIGTISGSRFYAGETAGSAKVEASFSSGGATEVASFTMTVKEEAVAVTLDRIQLISSSLLLHGYESATLTVIAHYSNGTEKNVTGSAGLSNSSPDVGSLSGNVFTAYMAEGSATITATYTEGGVTKTDGVLIAVTY